MFSIDRYPNLVSPVIIFLLAFFISLHVTGGLKRVRQWKFLLDHPGARKPQASGIPCTGGIAIFLAVAGSLIITYLLSRNLSPHGAHELRLILGVGLGIATVGLLDDFFGIRATIKLAVLAAACLVLTVNGIGLNRTPYPLLNYLLTFLWVAGVASAFNAIDNTDGLAGSVCLICAFALFLMGWSSWQLCFSFLCMALAGSVFGFLHHNVNPAKIYMGDSGSFFLGYVLAVIVIYADWSDSGLRSLFSGCLVLAYPIYDLGLTTLLRIRHGIVKSPVEAIAYSDRDHLSHRLLKLGYTHRQMLSVLCAITTGCCLLALLVIHAPWHIVILGLCAAGALLGGFGFYLDRRTSARGLWVNGKEPATDLEAGEAQHA